MRSRLLPLAIAFAAATSHVAHAQVRPPKAGVVNIVIETALGDIMVALDSAHAPRSVTNFLRYVDDRAFTDGRFHRAVTLDNQPKDSVKIEVIQGSVRPGGATQTGSPVRYPPIAIETTSETGLHHTDGAISMARAGPNSATSSFFLCVGSQPALDFGGHRNLDGQGFAAFGYVTSGMEIVRRIQRSPSEVQNLTPPVTIRGVRRAEPGDRGITKSPGRALYL